MRTSVYSVVFALLCGAISAAVCGRAGYAQSWAVAEADNREWWGSKCEGYEVMHRIYMVDGWHEIPCAAPPDGIERYGKWAMFVDSRGEMLYRQVSAD